MALDLDAIADILAFINGVILLIIGLIILRLYFRYKTRTYFLITLVLISSGLQMLIGEVDIFFPEDWESGLFSFLAALFGLIMVLLILVIILIPEKRYFEVEEAILPLKNRKNG